MKTDRVTMIVCISFLLLPLCACSRSNFPSGTFATKSGSWILTFTDEGNFTFTEFSTIATEGTFSIQANELTWETDSFCDRIGAGKATYIWTFEVDTLLFQVKGEDKCAGRLSVLDNVSYHKEQ
jgi:hypothetical protein